MTQTLRITTPCRLHFGLSSLGHDTARPQFGGVGLMVDLPGIDLAIEPAEEFTLTGPLHERSLAFAHRAIEQLGISALPRLAIHITAAQRQHVGLGIGTQLGLAIAAGIFESLGVPWRDPLRLSVISGRGRRSAVGTYGFLLGGLIIDSGHLPSAPLGQLHSRLQIPEAWRIALIIAPETTGQSGDEEDRVLRELPPVPLKRTQELQAIATRDITAALAHEDFAEFSKAIYRYGKLAGELFAPAQGGPFAAGTTTQLIEWLRAESIQGVGQSSWGPTVFALLDNEASAGQLRNALATHPQFSRHEVKIGAAANSGVRIEYGNGLA
jgi:beta-ribofuranosylaminobenzene 5'-phosphate synthase